jgi:hypothetical protein
MAYDNYRSGRDWGRDDRWGGRNREREDPDREYYRGRESGHSGSPYREDREFDAEYPERREYGGYGGRSRGEGEYRGTGFTGGREWADARARERWEANTRGESRRRWGNEWADNDYDPDGGRYGIAPQTSQERTARWSGPRYRGGYSSEDLPPGAGSPRDYNSERFNRQPYNAGPAIGTAAIRTDYVTWTERRPGGFAGLGPRSYTRSDERIREDINEDLTSDPRIDASDIEVTVQNGEVTLMGEVERRGDKRIAEEIAESVRGVKDVDNRLKARRGLLEEMFGRHEDTFGKRDRERDREWDGSATTADPPSARLTPNVSLAGPAPAKER